MIHLGYTREYEWIYQQQLVHVSYWVTQWVGVCWVEHLLTAATEMHYTWKSRGKPASSLYRGK